MDIIGEEKEISGENRKGEMKISELRSTVSEIVSKEDYMHLTAIRTIKNESVNLVTGQKK